MTTQILECIDCSVKRRDEILSEKNEQTAMEGDGMELGSGDAWAVPHLKFWGDRPPSPLKSPPMPITPSY